MSNQYRSSYVPAIVEDVLPPPPTPHPEPPLTREGVRAETAWLVVTLSIMLMTLVLFTAMIIDGSTARQAINAGTKFFALTMGLVVLILSGALTDILRAWWRERNERRRIDAWADLAEQALAWRMKIEDNRRAELERDSLPADLKRRLAALERELLDRDLDRADADPLRTPTWVQPYPTRREAAPALDARTEALRWAAGLYQEDGTPNPELVQMTGKETAIGRIQNIRMVGSARDGGSEAARLFLLDRAIILPSRYGYSLNIAKYPRADTLRYVE